MFLTSIGFIMAIALPMLVMTVLIMISARALMDREKTSPFECGFDPNHMSRIPFSMRFFLLAIIFLVFDIEIVLLMPLPMSQLHNKQIIIGAQLFLMILLLGLYHEWNQGSLNWTNWNLLESF